MRPWWIGAAVACTLVATAARADDGYRPVHSFVQKVGGYLPNGPVAYTDPVSHEWALYGTTTEGGLTVSPQCQNFNDGTSAGYDQGCGIAYKFTPPAPGAAYGSERRLYVFQGGTDGAYPTSRLIFDASGAAYGTTVLGGGPDNAGTVFRLTPPTSGQYFWNEQILHSFNFAGGGFEPQSGVVMDAAGALYGTAQGGEADGYGGIVYRLAPPAAGQSSWSFTILYTFSGAEYNEPFAGLIFDPAGALYGATSAGITSYGNFGGTVFKLSPPASGHGDWTLSKLYTFPPLVYAGVALQGPIVSLVRDASGTLYGASNYGGPKGRGLNGGVFSLSPPSGGQSTWTYKVLHTFSGYDGANPNGLAILDASGGIYGSTASGYTVNPNGTSTTFGGLLFKLTPPAAGGGAWSEKVLHKFGLPQSDNQSGAMIRAPDGVLYGSRSRYGGGPNSGFLYKLLFQ